MAVDLPARGVPESWIVDNHTREATMEITRNRVVRWIGSLACSICLLKAVPAASQMVALVSPTSVATIYDINLATGATSSPRVLTYSSTPSGGFVGISTSPSNVTYGISNNQTTASSPAYAYRIFQINRATGSMSLGPKLILNNQDFQVGYGACPINRKWSR